MTSSNEWKQHVHPKLLGKYVNAIKKRDRTDQHCALSLFLTIDMECNDRAISFDLVPFFDKCQPLIDAYHKRENWDDVLTHVLQK